jgi:hypothetical protein
MVNIAYILYNIVQLAALRQRQAHRGARVSQSASQRVSALPKSESRGKSRSIVSIAAADHDGRAGVEGQSSSWRRPPARWGPSCQRTWPNASRWPSYRRRYGRPRQLLCRRPPSPVVVSPPTHPYGARTLTRWTNLNHAAAAATAGVAVGGSPGDLQGAEYVRVLRCRRQRLHGRPGVCQDGS